MPIKPEGDKLFDENLQNSFLFEDFYHSNNFPNPQYLGCKQRLLPWIFSFVPKDAETFFDAFAGSQSVAFEAKKRNYKVYSNDFMSFSNQIGKSLIENSSEKLSKNDLQILFSKNENKGDLIQKLFENVFFVKQDAEFLDNFRANVNLLKGEYKKNLALASMNRALTRKTIMGHFAHMQALNYANNPERIKRNPTIARNVEDLFIDLVVKYNSAIFDNGKENKSFQGDVLEILPKLKDVDLVYFDPPYCGSHSDYQSFYHLLETFTEYWTDKKFVNKNNKYFPLRKSGFDKKGEIINSLEKMMEKSKHIKYVLISYNDRSYPKIDDFINLIKKYRNEVELFEKSYENSRGGKGSVKGSKEYIIRCK